jgi:hypothetical protein
LGEHRAQLWEKEASLKAELSWVSREITPFRHLHSIIFDFKGKYKAWEKLTRQLSLKS